MSEDLTDKAVATADSVIDEAVGKASKTRIGSAVGMAVIVAVAAGALAKSKHKKSTEAN